MNNGGTIPCFWCGKPMEWKRQTYYKGGCHGIMCAAWSRLNPNGSPHVCKRSDYKEQMERLIPDGTPVKEFVDSIIADAVCGSAREER